MTDVTRALSRSLLAAVLTAVTAVAAVGGEGLVQQGDRHAAAFENAKALECYRKAYATAPDDADLLTKLTWAYNNVGEDLASKASEAYFEEAVRHAEALERLAPTRASTYVLLAITRGNLALHRGGRQKVVLSRTLEHDARRAIELDPACSPAYATLGIYYREVAGLNWFLRKVAEELLGGLPGGTLEDSERMLSKAIEADPGNVYAHYQMALTLEALKRPAAAREFYGKVLSLPVVDHQDPLFREWSSQRLAKLGA